MVRKNISMDLKKPTIINILPLSIKKTRNYYRMMVRKRIKMRNKNLLLKSMITNISKYFMKTSQRWFKALSNL